MAELSAGSDEWAIPRACPSLIPTSQHGEFAKAIRLKSPGAGHSRVSKLIDTDNYGLSTRNRYARPEPVNTPLVGPFMYAGGGVFSAGRGTAIRVFDDLKLNFDKIASAPP